MPTGNGLRLEQLNLISAGGPLMGDTKLLHYGGSDSDAASCKVHVRPAAASLDRYRPTVRYWYPRYSNLD